MVKVFLIGAMGALAPEIVRLHTLATSGRAVVWSPAFYIPISILMAGLGGLIAVILPSENLQSAFYAGIGTPTLIAAAAKKLRAKEASEPLEVDTTKHENSGPSVPQPHTPRVDAFLKAL